MKEKLLRLYDREGTKTVISSVISIIIGMIVGSIIIVIVGSSTKSLGISSVREGIALVFAGLFSTGRNAAGTLTFGFNSGNFGNMLFRATPMILTGLSVAVAYKTGLFNIGAPGQYLMGTAATLYVALSIPTASSQLYENGVVPTWLVWLLALLAGMAAGALWGAIPGLVKAYLNINEVLACIMCNWIAANLVTWVFEGSSLRNMVESGKTGYIYKTSYNGVATAKLGLNKIFAGSQINAGILIAILLAVAVFILMEKTTMGYQLKACGSNRHSARYAGIPDKRNIVLSMALAGALAGTGAALYYLAGNTEFFWSTYQSLPDTGFNGIPVALLASCHPVGVVFTGCFMSMLDICGLQLTNLTAYNEYITDVIIAIIVYLSAFSMLIRSMLTRKKHDDSAPNSNAEDDSPPPGDPGEVSSAAKGGGEA